MYIKALTLLCRQPSGGQLPVGCWEEVLEVLKTVELEMGAALGDTVNPLLLSVRSGAAVSGCGFAMVRLPVCQLWPNTLTS